MEKAELNNYEMKINNKKIYEFYKNNTSLDFETINLMIIDFIDNITSNTNSNTNSSFNQEMLKNIFELKSDIKNINSKVNTLNEDVTNKLILNIQERNKEYTDVIKNIVLNKNNEDEKNLLKTLEDKNIEIIRNLASLFENNIPKNNELLKNNLNEELKHIQENILLNTKDLLSSSNKEESLNSFLSNFDSKTSLMIQNLHQPMINQIKDVETNLNKNINELQNNNSLHTKILGEVGDFFDKYKNSSSKGQMEETKLENVLTNLYPCAEIINSTNMTACCDFKINRDNFDSILIETKAYNKNVSKEEVNKFVRDIEENKLNGIFLSQHTGITSKQNFEINRIKNNVVLYIHNVNYDELTIKIAVSIIDFLNNTLKKNNNEDATYSFNEEQLKLFNVEITEFYNSKKELLNYIKESNKKIVGDLEKLELDNFLKYLQTNFGTNITNKILCTNCNNFWAKNNKSLAAHQKKCNSKTINMNF